MIKRVIVLLLMLMLLVVSPLVGCSSSSGGVTNPIGLVPKKANMVGKIDLKSIMEDKDLTGLYDKASKNPDQPQTFNEALNKAKQETGIDFKNFEEAIYFADTSESTDDAGYVGILVKGTFEKDKLIASIEKYGEMELSPSDYRGYQIYTTDNGDSGGVFFNNTMFVVGSMQAVKDVIDVKKGDEKAISGDVLDTYNQQGDALIKLAVSVPEGLGGENLPSGAGELLGDLSAFQNVRTVGLTLTKNNQSIPIEVKLCCTDSDSAQSIEGAINGLIGLMGLMIAMSDNPEENQALASLLEEIDVNKSGSCVDVRLEIALSDIEELMEGSTEGLAGSFIEGFMEGFLGTNGADDYETDAQVVQLAASTFYSDVHSGWWDVNGDDDKNSASYFDDNVWGDSDTNNTQIELGHYYPTAIAKVSNHILTLSTTQSDPDNPDNPRINAGGVGATYAMIKAHAIWMGLLVNDAGDYTWVGGTTDRWEVSPLDDEYGLYLNNVPESTAADANYNGDSGTGMGGSYCWVVGMNGYVYGAYIGSNGYWYAGFSGTYP